jgi:hypothetical protein
MDELYFTAKYYFKCKLEYQCIFKALTGSLALGEYFSLKKKFLMENQENFTLSSPVIL